MQKKCLALKKGSMAKITVDCGRRFRYNLPNGPLSELPEAIESGALREAMLMGASLALEKLGKHTDQIEVVKLSCGRFSEGFRIEIEIGILDPIVDNEDPGEREPVAGQICRIESTDKEAICDQIVKQFWSCISFRKAKIQELSKALAALAQ